MYIESGWYITNEEEEIVQGAFPSKEAGERILGDIQNGAKEKGEEVPDYKVIHLPKDLPVPEPEDVRVPQAKSAGFGKPGENPPLTQP